MILKLENYVQVYWVVYTELIHICYINICVGCCYVINWWNINGIRYYLSFIWLKYRKCYNSVRAQAYQFYFQSCPGTCKNNKDCAECVAFGTGLYNSTACEKMCTNVKTAPLLEPASEYMKHDKLTLYGQFHFQYFLYWNLQVNTRKLINWPYMGSFTFNISLWEGLLRYVQSQ